MKKIKSIYEFINKCPNNKSKLRCFFVLLMSFFKVPAFFFHEAMHFIVAIIGGHDIEISEFYFFEINKKQLKTYKLSISYKTTELIGTIGCVAPLIGWIVGMFVLAITSHWWILSYFILASQMFFLSEQDILQMRDNGCNEKICSYLLYLYDRFFYPLDIDVKEKLPISYFIPIFKKQNKPSSRKFIIGNSLTGFTEKELTEKGYSKDYKPV